ncbi:MAG: MFS transporter [Firmicutes bacterium]|nr:MFS transporter [Bacillota bacterium]
MANTPNLQKVSITQVIENIANKKFVANLLIMGFLLSIIEAIDVAALAYVAPVLMKQWVIPAKVFGAVFGAGTFGLMVGGFIFGFLGDRIGRKKTLMIGIVWFSIFTLSCVWANSVHVLFYLRFLACVGLGGTVPLTIVLVNEYAPSRLRGRWVAGMFMGFSGGQGVGGILAAWLIPTFGWQSTFILGGTVPLLILIAIYFRVPESVKYLVVKNRDRDEVVRLVRLLQPGIAVGPDTVFFAEGGEMKEVIFTPKVLFAGVLAIATPLIWVFYILNSSTVYFFNSWLPQLQVASGFSVSHASLLTSVYQFSGMVCTLAVGWLFDKRGMLALVILPLFACLSVAVLGYPKSVVFMVINILFAGFFVVGTQAILTITTPIWYPTGYRSSANGLAMGLAKIGSISGPIIGGVLISANLPLKNLYLLNSIVLGIAVFIVLILALLYQRHYPQSTPVGKTIEQMNLPD